MRSDCIYNLHTAYFVLTSNILTRRIRLCLHNQCQWFESAWPSPQCAIGMRRFVTHSSHPKYVPESVRCSNATSSISTWPALAKASLMLAGFCAAFRASTSASPARRSRRARQTSKWTLRHAICTARRMRALAHKGQEVLLHQNRVRQPACVRLQISIVFK